jgi:hypothetical protein
MRCPTCGKQLPADPYFCAYCGTLIQAAPAPMPPLTLNLRSAGVAMAGLAAALPIGAGFWLLAGRLAQIPVAQALELGALVAVLSGCLAAALHGQVRWPLDAHPPHADPRQLAMIYGMGGGLAVALGSVFVGAAVLPAGWGSGSLDIPTVFAGATSGFVGAAFAVPPALLVGALAGELLGRLARRAPAPAAPWAAALAWWLAGSSGGAVVGLFVALQSNLTLATSAVIGALLQSVLQIVLFPVTTYLVRLTFLIVT